MCSFAIPAPALAEAFPALSPTARRLLRLPARAAEVAATPVAQTGESEAARHPATVDGVAAVLAAQTGEAVARVLHPLTVSAEADTGSATQTGDSDTAQCAVAAAEIGATPTAQADAAEVSEPQQEQLEVGGASAGRLGEGRVRGGRLRIELRCIRTVFVLHAMSGLTPLSSSFPLPFS